jgi:hypothetical protein
MRPMSCLPLPAPTTRAWKWEQELSPARNHITLRNDIWRELVFDEGDAVAELQLAFLQPLNLDDVGTRRFLQRSNRRIEVTMLLQKAGKLHPKLVFFLFRHFCLGRA